ncbi:ATP-binding protein [Basilea psittacipulmonis]|uniref:ATP-binding protein n=1 Tax=Basilea psittacipulmonis TaxID=1472345 RepID=UPI00068FC9C7|nr:ATP-binding protein [Basilea psittacipulmonis]
MKTLLEVFNSPNFSVVTGTCEVHGAYENIAYKDDKGECPKCRKERLEQEERAANRLLLKTRSQRIANIPERYINKNFDNFVVNSPEQLQAKEICQVFANEFKDHVGRSLIISGGVGAGKTHLALAILNTLIDRYLDGISCYFTTVTDVANRIKDSWERRKGVDYQETEWDIMRKLEKPSLLVLDEVGINDSDFEKSRLFSLINSRYNANKATILVTNLEIKELSNLLGERAIDRLREDGGKLINCVWGSYRSKA